MKPINLGPWSGIDNVHKPGDHTFQIPAEREERIGALVSAVNVDLDNDGWPSTRDGVTERAVSTDVKTLFVGAEMVLWQAAGTIYLVDLADWSMDALVTDLDEALPATFHEHAGQVFWSNGVESGRITSAGDDLNWGCTVPAVTLASVSSGSLRAGRYMVSALFVDASGIEHGAGKAQVITLAAGKSISVSLASVDASAVSVRVFASKPNGKELFFVKQVAVGALPAVIDDVEVSEEPIRKLMLKPPPAADCIFSYRGTLMVTVDEFIFPSYGVNAHLYEIGSKLEARPSIVIGGAGLDDGFWTITESDGAYWTTGSTPETWQTWQKSGLEFAAGALVLDGGLIPKLQTKSNVALFASEHGLVAGLPGGMLVELQQDKVHMDVSGMRASIVYRERDGLRQVITNLT